MNSGQTRSLYRVAGANTTSLVAVGDSGTVLRSTDGGTVWTAEFAATGYNLYCAQTFGDSVILASGDNGTIIRTVPAGGTSTFASDQLKIGTSSPSTPVLFQNFPNPFNPTTVIRYSVPPMTGRDLASTSSEDGQLPASGKVRLAVYDMLGREVAVLVNERKEPGLHSVIFDARKLSSGVYFYRLEVGEFVATRQLLLIR